MDKLMSFGWVTWAICVLCNMEDESTDHLSFNCEFSKHVWRDILQVCGYNYIEKDLGKDMWKTSQKSGKGMV